MPNVVFGGEGLQLDLGLNFDWISLLRFVCLFGVLHRFQHCTGYITMGSWKGRGNQYIQFVRVLYCKLPTNGKQLPAFPLEAVLGIEPWPQRWEARVLPLSHRGHFSLLRASSFCSSISVSLALRFIKSMML